MKNELTKFENALVKIADAVAVARKAALALEFEQAWSKLFEARVILNWALVWLKVAKCYPDSFGLGDNLVKDADDIKLS